MDQNSETGFKILIFFLQLPSLEPLKIEVISGDFSSD
jgi:hypothetical protein